MDIDWFYVNLASRPDRNEHAKEQFARHGIKAKRLDAYLPADWDGSEEKVARMRARTPGAIGCYMSQMRLIEAAIGHNYVIAVCEDDVCFCDDLLKRLEYIGKHLTWDWDIFYLGATFHVPGVWCNDPECSDWGAIGCDVKTTPDPRILRTFGIWGTYAYLVNPANAAKVHKTFDKNIYRADGIDHLCILLGPRLKTFCFVPGCAWQYDNQSNIGSGITHFSSFKPRLGPYAWQDRMEDFDPAKYDWIKGGEIAEYQNKK